MTTDYLSIAHPPSRIQAILTSAAPITLLAANEMITENLSVALRIAYDLHLYHKLDSEIITESVALHRNQHGTWPTGNVVFIGTASSQFAKLVLQEGKTSFQIVDSRIEFNHRCFNKPGEGCLQLPFFSRFGLLCFYSGSIHTPSSGRRTRKHAIYCAQ